MKELPIQVSRPAGAVAGVAAPSSVQDAAAASSDRRFAELGALLVMVIWAGNFIVVKDALVELPPVAFTTIRFVLASVALLIVCRWREGSIALPRRDVLPIAVLGAIGFGIYQTLWTVALDQTTASDSSLLVASTPIFTLLIAAAIGSDHLTRGRLVGAVVSFAGVALVVASAGSTGFAGHLVGDVITVIAAGLWAIYVAFGAPVLRRHSPLRMVTWAVTFGTIVMAPIGLWQLSGANLSNLTIATPLALLYSGLLSIAFGNVAQFRAVQVIGPARATALQFLVPPMTVVLAAIFLNERIRVEQLLGGAVILAGIAIARSSRLLPTAASARA
jgi:drug/metabolite transporter (DMT)-like permease